ncbi:MAG: hypothetical protein HYU97_01910 [Deltaproteobacteria bacterium]|nr:hypothetical protein [Deltaproteobacteria bacterium]
MSAARDSASSGDIDSVDQYLSDYAKYAEKAQLPMLDDEKVAGIREQAGRIRALLKDPTNRQIIIERLITYVNDMLQSPDRYEFRSTFLACNFANSFFQIDVYEKSNGDRVLSFQTEGDTPNRWIASLSGELHFDLSTEGDTALLTAALKKFLEIKSQ